MKVLILEDESGAAQNLLDVLDQSKTDFEVMAVIETVQNAVKWLENHTPDLAFFDIRLADGESFDVFQQVSVAFPIIFTTAYDAYAVEAFKVNSIGYLLKPVGLQELEDTMEKLASLRGSVTGEWMEKLANDLRSKPQYRKSFLTHKRDQMIPVPVDKIAYFSVSQAGTHITTTDNKTYPIDPVLNEVEEQVDPKAFFRLNRQYLAARESIISVSQHFHRKLKAHLHPSPAEEVIVSKLKAPNLLKWLEGTG